MQNLLNKLLERKGIKDTTQLTKEERETYDSLARQIKAIESEKKELTVERIAQFCGEQLEAIEALLHNLDNSSEKNERLIILHSVWKQIGNFIKSPETKAKYLEGYLQQLLHNEKK